MIVTMIGIASGVAWVLYGPDAALVVMLVLIPLGVVAQTLWPTRVERGPKSGRGWGWTLGLMLSWFGPIPYVSIHRRPR